MADLGYVVAGYALTAASLSAYVGWLARRARRARASARAVAADRSRES